MAISFLLAEENLKKKLEKASEFLCLFYGVICRVKCTRLVSGDGVGFMVWSFGILIFTFGSKVFVKNYWFHFSCI